MADAQKPDRPAVETTDWRAIAARLAALGSIASEAAHRFNNLRAIIEGTLELLAAEPGGLRVAQRLDRIREAATRGQALAEGIVAVARSRQGRENLLDLAAWLSAIRPSLQALLGEGRGLVIEVPPPPLTLLCDPDEFRSVLTALLLNAAASLGPAGNVKIRLEPRPADGHGHLLLSVADDGAGMPPEVAARAREPFFTTRPPAAGLGLTAAEAFASRNGGRLELSSSPGHGTIVSLWLAEAGARDTTLTGTLQFRSAMI